MNEKISLLKEALEKAEVSKDEVKIAQCSLEYGIELLNTGKLPHAEMQFTRIIKLAEDKKENDDLQRVLAETYLVRGNILMGKSLYNQAVHLLELAITLLIKFKNNDLLVSAHRVLAKAYKCLGDEEKATESEKNVEYYQAKAK